MKRLRVLPFIVPLLWLLLGFHPASAQVALVVGTCGTNPSPVPATGLPYWLTVNAQGVLCTNATGGTGGTASNFSAAFPATGTAIGLSNGTNMLPLLADASGYAEVNCKAGCATGTVSNASSAMATSSTNTGSVSY